MCIPILWLADVGCFPPSSLLQSLKAAINHHAQSHALARAGPCRHEWPRRAHRRAANLFAAGHTWDVCEPRGMCYNIIYIYMYIIITLYVFYVQV